LPRAAVERLVGPRRRDLQHLAPSRELHALDGFERQPRGRLYLPDGGLDGALASERRAELPREGFVDALVMFRAVYGVFVPE
jgi:hypothetical protein